MKVVPKSVAALIVETLMSSAFAPASAASFGSDRIRVAEASSPHNAVHSSTPILGALEFPQVRNRTDVEKNCTPGHLYSADNIVGDPQACIIRTYSGIRGYLFHSRWCVGAGAQNTPQQYASIVPSRTRPHVNICLMVAAERRTIES